MRENIVFIGSVMVLVGYVIQLATASITALSSNQSGYENSLVSWLFGGQNAAVRTWKTIGMVLFIPLLVSWCTGIPALMEQQSSEIHLLLFPLILSMILIFVTLELSQLAAIGPATDRWGMLLTAALVLDVVVVIILIVIRSGQYAGMIWAYALGAVAFASSFSIIFFSIGDNARFLERQED